MDYYNIMFDDNVDPNNLKCYNMCETMRLANSSEIYGIIENPRFWKFPTLLDGAKTYIELLNEEYDVVIVTRTSYRNCLHKFNRLLELLPFLQHEQIIICFDKSKINYDILIDDNPEFLDKNKKGIIMDWTYNRYCEDFPRAYSWKGIYDMVHLLLDKEE